MKCRGPFSLSNDCTEIEYWKLLKNVRRLSSPTLFQKSLFSRNGINIPLEKRDLNRFDSKSLESSIVESISLKSALNNDNTYRR